MIGREGIYHHSRRVLFSVIQARYGNENCQFQFEIIVIYGACKIIRMLR